MHYHCSTCEDGDFDLCQACVDDGVACNSSDHWLIKRTTNKAGQVITSTTETVTPGEKSKVAWETAQQGIAKLSLNGQSRTCNGCVQGMSRSLGICLVFATSLTLLLCRVPCLRLPPLPGVRGL